MDYWKSCKVLLFKSNGNEFVKLTALRISGGITWSSNWIYLSREIYSILLNTQYIENIDYQFSPDVFSFLKFGPFEPNGSPLEPKKFEQKAYVTNAVANNVAYYAWVYLLESNLTNQQIVGLRKKYSLENVSAAQFKVDELLSSFVSQSAFFLNLVAYMHENDRFYAIIEAMEPDKLAKYYKGYEGAEQVLKRYERRVFHWMLECEYMRHDYNEPDGQYANTRVFFESQLVKKPGLEIGGYLISADYLRALGMRSCRICDKIRISHIR